MSLLRPLVKAGGAGLFGLGVSKAPGDLAVFLRDTADWVESGGSVHVVLWAICITFAVWALFDVWKCWRERKDAKRAVTQHYRDGDERVTIKEESETKLINSRVTKREAAAKARLDQVNAELRTFEHNIRSAFGTILLALLGGAGREDKDDKGQR